MKLYKLRHKKTGLYFCPLRSVHVKYDGNSYWVKSNLSKKGKLYKIDPRNMIDDVHDHTELKKVQGSWGYVIEPLVCEFNKNDFEFIEFSVAEIPRTGQLFEL